MALWVPAFAGQDSIKADFAKESVVIEQSKTKVVLQNDGTYSSEHYVRARVQSDAGVRQYGVLPFSYLSSAGSVELQDVRVTKQNGSVVSTPLDSVQDVTPEIYRDAPMYSDLREKHVAVKGLEPGDTLEYSVRWQTDKPLIPGQFWLSFQFLKNSVVLDEQLQVSVPREREIKLKSRTIQPTMKEESGRRIYTWKTSNLESRSVEEQNKEQAYYAFRGLLSQPDVLISSFRTWEEVGRWYESLQQEKIQPSPEVISKAEELTKGLLDDDAKLRAIYSYVSLRYRYIGIAFGIGRYQPHAAGEILGNQYGDCKDKHTLLAALLKAVGIHAYPALISSQTAVDLDVPSPGQFNHVISVVSKGGALSWMDTTPEVASIGYLMYPLRGKLALVITPDKVAFQTTPASPPFPSEDQYTVTAKLDSDGTLQAHVAGTDRGSYEFAYRSAFRRVPESQWKDFGQQTFYGARLGGTVNGVELNSLEKTEEPLHLAYDYSLKDFSGGDKHRFIVPLSPFNIPEVKDNDLTRKIPLWLGDVGAAQYESHLELPKGWTVTAPAAMDLKESFAEYHEDSDLKAGVLVTRRRLLLKANEITTDQLKNYKAFQKAISDRHDTYVFMHAPTEPGIGTSAATPAQGMVRFGQLLREGVMQLPGSSNSEALQAERDALNFAQAKDYTSVITALKRAVSLDATFSRAWIRLGATYLGTREASSALNAFQKAADADPKRALPLKILAFLYMGIGKQDDAIATWQKLQTVAVDDPDLWSNLSALYLVQKRYAEATALLESAVKSQTSDPWLYLSLGTARLRSKSRDQGLEALHKALELNSNPEMLNDAAYEMAETDTNLSEALGYSQKCVNETETKLEQVDLGSIRKEDLQLTVAIGAYWDTLGWIYLKMGNLTLAETYLSSAWELAQDGLIGDHLGQLYEKKHKLPEALHMYNLALQASPLMTETQARMRALAHVHLPEHRMSAGEELSWMRTVKLPKLIDESASADFDLLIVTNGKIQKAVFVQGSEPLRNAGRSLEQASFTQALPRGSIAYLPRRGVLSCGSAGCSFVFYRPSVAVDRFGQNTSADMHGPPSTSPAGATTPAPVGAAPSLGVLHVGGSVTPPRAIYSPEPEYTKQARKSNFQGSCTLGLIVEEDGHPSHIRVLKGIGLGLDENAVAAVQTWRFEPAMKDGHPVRVEIAIQVDFHLFQKAPDSN